MVISFTKLGNYGRLGNQMFQYASIKSISLRNNYEFKIPNHQFDVKDLNLNCRTLESQDRLTSKYVERYFHFNESVFDLPDGTDFHGYFQSYKYFQDYSDTIQNEFTVKPQFEDKATEFIEKHFYTDANNAGTVSIHIRRGDYLKLKEFHPFCGIEYYFKTIKEFRDLGQYVFFVCSDDIEWCKHNIVGENIYYSEANNPYVDLAIMYQCDHNIIANSSFSWWGAWLNRNPNKIIFYPSVWFGPKCPADWYDLIPPQWEKIKV